ncbi:hypothetical protein OGAPHI_000805 [Ogataea philodendri]|uniref:Uncharacterized protein n=1 Tax=Ogataea philodendri TaxID=1378263 RepID=A0A9P8PGM9_9ASCO|nr:uncharacterized protein OGAPHI_000805 [Ogataea philodendri]KAH3671094.1 hypothetical protein OGAPHI_000805 [Ogataea philodendri]
MISEFIHSSPGEPPKPQQPPGQSSRLHSGPAGHMVADWWSHRGHVTNNPVDLEVVCGFDLERGVEPKLERSRGRPVEQTLQGLLENRSGKSVTLDNRSSCVVDQAFHFGQTYLVVRAHKNVDGVSGKRSRAGEVVVEFAGFSKVLEHGSILLQIAMRSDWILQRGVDDATRAVCCRAAGEQHDTRSGL